MQYGPAVYIVQRIAAGTFRVWHHAKYITSFVADTGNITCCTIRIRIDMNLSLFIAITKYHLVIFIQFFQRRRICKIPAFSMCYRYLQYGISYILTNDIAFVLTLNENILTNKLLMIVLQQYTWQQTRLT